MLDIPLINILGKISRFLDLCIYYLCFHIWPLVILYLQHDYGTSSACLLSLGEVRKMQYSGSAKTFQFDLDMVRHLLHDRLQYNLPICIRLNIAILKSIDAFIYQQISQV